MQGAGNQELKRMLKYALILAIIAVVVIVAFVLLVSSVVKAKPSGCVGTNGYGCSSAAAYSNHTVVVKVSPPQNATIVAVGCSNSTASPWNFTAANYSITQFQESNLTFKCPPPAPNANDNLYIITTTPINSLAINTTTPIQQTVTKVSTISGSLSYISGGGGGGGGGGPPATVASASSTSTITVPAVPPGGITEWSSTTGYPIAVDQLSCTTYNNTLYCVGGYGNGKSSVSGCNGPGGGTLQNGVCYVNLTASNNPNMYLGSYIGYEPWSDWMHYAPLINTVNQVTAGKTSAYDKAFAIANYVSKSKPYNASGQSVANFGGTVIDIYNEPTGVCLDAATLTVAMLRLAGIPARIIYPNNLFHAYAEAYVNGKWIGIDSTFGSLLFNLNLTNIGTTNTHWGNLSRVNITDPISGNYYYRNVSLSYSELIPRNNFGEITYPSSPKQIYGNGAGYALSYTYTPSPASSSGPLRCFFEANNLQCGWYNCNITTPTNYAYVGAEAGLSGWGYSSLYNKLSTYYPTYNGHITSTLPADAYKVQCGLQPNNFTAYAYVNVIAGQNVNVTQSMFQKPSGVSNSDFNITMQTLFSSGVGGNVVVNGATNLVYFASVSGSGVGMWSGGALYPTPIFQESCATYSGYIYCIGGDNTSQSVNPSGVSYYAQISSNSVRSWAQTTAYPVKVQQESCVASSGYIYCVGGTANTLAGYSPTNAVYSAPISSNGIGTWSSTTPYPIAASAQNCAIYNGMIYCQNENAAYFAPLSGSGIGAWSSANSTSISFAQYNSGICAASGGYFYCPSANLNAANLTRPNGFTYFSPLSSGGIDNWQVTANYPIFVYGHRCATTNGYIYCVGGYTGSDYTNLVYYAAIASSAVTSSTTTTTITSTTTTAVGATQLIAYQPTYNNNQVLLNGQETPLITGDKVDMYLSSPTGSPFVKSASYAVLSNGVWAAGVSTPCGTYPGGVPCPGQPSYQILPTNGQVYFISELSGAKSNTVSFSVPNGASTSSVTTTIVATTTTTVGTPVTFGDTNLYTSYSEPIHGPQISCWMTSFSTTGPKTITSVTMGIRYPYTPQKFIFAVYGGTKPPTTLVASETNPYQEQGIDGWQTFNLAASDWLHIPSAGTYTLCFMAYTGGSDMYRSGGFDSNNNNCNAAWPWQYATWQAWPSTFTCGTGNAYGPYSFYATAT